MLPYLVQALLTVLLFASQAEATPSTRVSISLPSEVELDVLQYPADGHTLVIWVPSKRGIREGNEAFAQSIQATGIDYWLVDLHGSYLAPTGRYGYAQFDPRDITELVGHAVRQGWQRIILGGESRGAALVMKAGRLWQLDNPGDTHLKGYVVFHPYLIDGETPIGETAVFHPIARSTNLPVFIFQPELNPKYLHTRELLEQLQDGGASVYVKTLKGVRGGYHLREPDRLNTRERRVRDLVGSDIRQAIELLLDLPLPAAASRPHDRQDAARASAETPDDGLMAVLEQPRLPLSLPDGNGQLIDLGQFRDKVVLVNFWASWCGPCVKEIGSLMRLVEHFEDTDFEVLAVNISESPEAVAAFFDWRDITPNFKTVYDLDGTAARQWKVYAVPSTYLLDREHAVRFGYRGALRWDQPSVIETVESLLR
ncbi:MAG: redoxin domain-containing protein [Gammaproteobacteria bacterium]|nr:redoxin domain-containing protein [Gammaproteobacteria bacterium]